MSGKISTVGFYIGTFITSFGSLLFVMSVPAFFLSAGYYQEMIGLVIGVHRFSGIIATAWFGPQIDRYNSRKIIFLTEVSAALASVGLIATWWFRDDLGLGPFCTFVALRALSVGLQSTSRSRLIKLLSNDSHEFEASLAIWLNKVTQGSHLISALVALPLVASGNLIWAIAIDGLSFLIGGLSVLLLPDLDKSADKASSKSNLAKAIQNIFLLHKRTFIEDQLLALTVSGTILLMVKLSNGESGKVIYLNIIFGACIWLSSLVAHNLSMRNKTLVYWIFLFMGFIMLITFEHSKWLLLSYFITYFSYWILYHKYTVEFQTKTPRELIGATMATRNLAVAITLSVGEASGGYIGRVLSLNWELMIRALICLIAILWLLLRQRTVLNAK